MNQRLFNDTAENFASVTDDALAKGAYTRGNLFINALNRHVQAGAHVLDFGCGPGRIALLAARANYVVEGVDTSSGMVEVAKRQSLKGVDISFALCAGNGSELSPGRYDAVICSSVIEYVEEPDGLLANFARALKPAGMLMLTFSNRRSLWRAFVRMSQARRPHYELQRNIWTFVETRRHLEKAGFEIVEKPVYLEASPFDKRAVLRSASSWSLIGTLGFVVTTKRG